MKKKYYLLIATSVILITLVVVFRVRKPSDDGRDHAGSGTNRTGEGAPSVDGSTSQSDGDEGAGDSAAKISDHQQILNDRLRELNMSPVVRAVLGLNVEKDDRNARREALTKLTRTLSSDDIEGLSLFLDFRSKDNDELSSAAFNAIKNDALVVLLNQKSVPDGIGGKLAGMFEDKEHDNRWRDYLLQYLSQCYDRHSDPGSDEQKEIRAAYDMALNDRNEKFAGTALMAVERLSRSHSEFDRKEIGDKAVELALANDTHYDTKITALRVCAMMGRKEVVPQVRILAQTGETVPVRLAAIATLGDLGDERDLEYIESLAASDDKRLQRISETASANLKKRLADTGS